MTIQELIELHNGRTYETECNGTIKLQLKKSWGKAKIEETIEDFEKEIAKDKQFRDWKLAIKESLKVLHGYEVDDIPALWRDWERGLSVKDGTALIFKQLRRWHTETQGKTIQELGWAEEKFTHVYVDEYGNRLMKDCRSDKAFKIYPNGKYEIVRGVIYDWSLLRLFAIKLRHELSETTFVVTEGHSNYLQVCVYPFSEEKNPTWATVTLTYSNSTEDDDFDFDTLKSELKGKLIISGSNHHGNVNYISRLHEAEGLILAIAQDFDNFLLNPVSWLAKQS